MSSVVSCISDQDSQVGNEIRVTATFSNAVDNCNPIDPTEVFMSVLSPDGNQQDYKFGDPDETIIRDGIGVYYADIDIDIPGKWRVRFWSTGVGKASLEICFRVLGKET